jgi:hypothetical protein
MGSPLVERQRLIPSSPHTRRSCVSAYEDAAESPMAAGSPKIRRGRPGSALLGLAYTLFILGLVCVGFIAIRLGPNRISPVRTATQGQQAVTQGSATSLQELGNEVVNSKYGLQSGEAQDLRLQVGLSSHV